MEIGIKWIIAIIIALLLLYLVYLGIFQRYVPLANEATDVKMALSTNDLVRSCRDWTSNLVLDSTIPGSLREAAISQDILEDDRWGFCQVCYETAPRPRKPCRQCKAACVKLLIDEIGCRVSPAKFPDTFQYSTKTHKAIIDGGEVDMSYNTAYLYCVNSRIGDVKDRVERDVT